MPGVLQPAGDLGLEQEPLAAGRVVGVVVEDLLERDLAVQLAVERHEHRPQPAPGVRPQDAEPLAVAGRRADGVGGRAVGIAVLGRAVPGGHMAERRLDIRVAEPGQALARRLAGRHGGQALLDVAVLLEVQGDQRLEAGAGVGVQVTPGDEVVGQAPGLVARPGLEGGDELALVDQPVLKREQSEEEMAVGGGGHGMAPIVVGRSGEGPSLGGRPGNRVASAGLSQVRHAFASAPSRGMHRVDVNVAAVAGGTIIKREHNKT